MIPLHSLVMIIGHNSKDKRHLIKNLFQDYEIVNKEKISYLFFGENTNNKYEFIMSEYLNLVKTKLSFGERVVLTDNFFSNEERLFFKELAKKYNINIYYILTDDIYDSNIINDDEAIVYNIHDNFSVVEKFKSPINIFELKMKGFQGITVIPDIHGNIHAMNKAVNWALARKNLIVFLGDIVDYGLHSLDCIYLAYDLLVNGQAIFIKGNHERKLDKWFQQEEKIKLNLDDTNLNVSQSNKVTIDQIKNLSKEDFMFLKYKFSTIINLSANHWIIDDFLFTHGACEPEMFSIYNKNLHGRLEKIALFGESDYNQKNEGYQARTYNWVNRIPTNKTVFVGHDIRSYKYPYFEENSYGGQVYFLDTGCSKNGKLTTADIIIENNKLSVLNFNKHLE